MSAATNDTTVKRAIVIGGGPAGLMAAEQLLAAGIEVTLYEAMPSVGRKLLRAGIGGLNISHAEPMAAFRGRFGAASTATERWLDTFGRDHLLDWCAALGVETFVGSSGRIFPTEKKAAPLLRRWLQRLRSQGLTILTRHRWVGWTSAGELLLAGPEGQFSDRADAVILACGGGSWAKLGSDGKWLPTLAEKGVECAPLQAANCGFNYSWPALMADHFGQPLKNIGLSMLLADGRTWQRRGDALVSHYGLEGSLVYAASAGIRDTINQNGTCTIHWDLFPDRSAEALRQALNKRASRDSIGNVLRKQWRLSGAKLGLLKALTDKAQMADLASLPERVKALPQTLNSPRPLDEAISTAGGVRLDAVDARLMLKTLPGVFCAGEMLDWEAPTGGYLLTACFASGVVAGRGAAAFVSQS